MRHTDFRPEIIIFLVVLCEYNVSELFGGQSHSLSSDLKCPGQKRYEVLTHDSIILNCIVEQFLLDS